jgi:hypothetical protein
MARILSTHCAETIDPEINRKIRDQYPIELSGEFMRMENDRG